MSFQPASELGEKSFCYRRDKALDLHFTERLRETTPRFAAESAVNLCHLRMKWRSQGAADDWADRRDDWKSTAIYYKEINEIVRQRRGGLASADILLRSVDFGYIVTLKSAGDWRQAAAHLTRVARQLFDAGARCILICTNTMHVIAES